MVELALPPCSGLSPSLSSLLTPNSFLGPKMGEHFARKATKADVEEEFVRRLRQRRNIVIDSALLASVHEHFQLLPSRYALDVNISSLDVLNHK